MSADRVCVHGEPESGCWACVLPAVVLHCPHLGRDLRNILGAVPHAQVLTGRRTEPGEAGCLEMHKQAIRLAVARGWPRVWVLEDDCHFTAAFRLRDWVHDVLLAHQSGYDTVFGGTVRTHDAVLAKTIDDGVRVRHLVGTSRCCSAHCVAHHESGYDAVLRCEQPYDLQLGVQGARCAVTLPFVAIQRAGLSGIGPPLDQGDSVRYAGPQVVDYEGLFAGYQGALSAAVLEAVRS